MKLSLIIFSFVSSTALATGHPIVGYGSSDAVLPAKNQEMFLMGFELGFEQKLKGRSVSESLVVDQTSDGSQLGAVTSARHLLDKGVALIVGFPTSQEDLLAAKLAKEKGVLSISAAAGHADLGEMVPTVFTLGESMATSVIEARKFARGTFAKKRGLLITNAYAVFSKNQEDTFKKEAAKDNANEVNLSPVHLKQDLTLENSVIEELKERKFDYVVLTTYASDAVKLLEQLEKNKIDLPMLVSSSWTMGDVDSGRRYLTARHSPTYVASDWSQMSQYSPAVEKLVKIKYGRAATAEIIAGYDLGVITAKVLNSIKGVVTKESVAAAFVDQHCFDDLATGHICFDRKGGHAIREITFRQFTAKGFVDVPRGIKK